MGKMTRFIHVVLAFALFFAWTSARALTMTLTPTTCSSVTGIGSVAWTNPGNATGNNSSYATATLNASTSRYLECTGYNFAIPDGAVINGITVSVDRHAATAGVIKDAAVRVVKAGVIGTTDRSTSTTYTTTDVLEAHGSSTDLWGTTWTAADIRDANFGAAFAAVKSATGNTAVSVDMIQITVDYTIPAMSCTPPSNAPAGVSLSCVCDNFGRSALNPSTIFGSNWNTSTSDTTGILPNITNPGYLRLTNNTGNNAKAVTVPGIFPAAGNYISVEFQQFAYNGTNPGADGIAVTLSDYSIAPVPGAFGGSLGYAQKTGTACTSSGATTCPGFAGGWIGVALDEWGNYQNPTEGRIGGPGAVSQSVGVRGSGSGTTGYNWIAGTGTLNPAIDDSTSKTPSLGEYYQVIVDARTATATSVAVNRDTGSGYTSLISIPNIFTAATAQGFTQNPVPDNWQISFTGSTGGANNIHEIGGLKICAENVQPPTGGTAGGFAVIDEAYGTPPSVAVQNYLSGHIYTKLVGTPFKLDVGVIQNSQILTTYAISSAKTVTLKLVDNSDGACVLDSSQANYCNSTCTAKAAVTGGSQTLTFASGASDKGQKQSANFTLNSAYKNLVAITTDGSTTACSVDAFSVRPTSVTVASVATPTGATNAATNTGTTGTPVFKAGSDKFALTATVPGVTGNPSGYTGTLKINNSAILSTATVAGTFNGPTTFPAATSATPDATTTNTNFTYDEVGGFLLRGYAPASDATSVRGIYDGVATATECSGLTAAQCDALKAAAWTGVDAISSKKDCIVDSYSNTKDATGKYGCNFGLITNSSTFGRFIPSSFGISQISTTPYIQTRSDLGCSPSSTFTYMGEPMKVSFQLSALNAAGNVTKNYAGSYAKIATTNWLTYGSADSIGFWAVGNNYPVGANTCRAVFSNTTPSTTSFLSCTGGASVASVSRAAGPRVTVSGASTPSWTNGVSSFTANVTLERADVPDGPYSSLALAIAPQDSDGVTLAAATFNTDADSTTGNERGLLATTDVRYGRLLIANAYGSQLVDLPVSVTAQYWDATATPARYKTNPDDGCTNLTSNLGFTYTGGSSLTAANMGSSHITGTGTLSSGTKSLLLTKPSPTITTNGFVDLNVLSSAPFYNYLYGIGRETFGEYKSQFIYLRELY